jgi:DNA polymerase-3 subunit alpha
VESAGLLKMDFGFKTLTLIKYSQTGKIQNGIDLDPDAFPIDDVKTYELFNGRNGRDFQYESPGMQKYMKELKPTVFS